MLLLDSHVLLWYLDTGPDLSAQVRTRIDTEPSVFVSVVSAWELRIKSALGKLTMPDDLAAQLTAARFDVLPITLAHALAAGALPRHHRDPFDRMLVAQAQLEGLTLVTHDVRMRPYSVPVLWA
ncbi:MAG TPA: type II toxin-antitoxin system VapC family toxin [Candidatus Tectomicrobia bacterium]